jgi:hypothetical protein
MHLEIVDSLRCPADHEDTWLVASIAEWNGRHIMRATLGCPICHVTYPVARGTADFSGTAPDEHVTRVVAGRPTAGETELQRLAAQLDLRDPGGIVLLVGRYAAMANELEGVTAAHYLTIATPGDPAAATAPEETLLRIRDRLPLAAASVRAAAVEGLPPLAPAADEIARVLRAGGRLVAPTAAPLPPGIRELARDEREWVGERLADGAAPVPLERRR